MALAADPKSRKTARGTLPPLSVAQEFMKADKTSKAYKKTERVQQKPRPPGTPKKNLGSWTKAALSRTGNKKKND
jgi:hypothetical protein